MPKFEKTNEAIYRTKDYSLFKTVKGNRAVADHHVLNIMKSIMKKNMMNKLPIGINEKFEIIDGQHRFEYAKNNDEWVYFTIIEGAGLTEVQLLNAYSRPWLLADYLNSYCSLGYRDYLILRAFCTKYKLAVSTGYRLLSTSAEVNHGLGMTKFKEGGFTVDRLEYGKKIMSIFNDFLPYLTLEASKDRNVVSTAIKLEASPEYDHNKMLEQLEKSRTTIDRQGNVKSYTKLFEDVYAYHTKNIVRFTGKTRGDGLKYKRAKAEKVAAKVEVAKVAAK
jgi:hypothetical protein